MLLVWIDFIEVTISKKPFCSVLKTVRHHSGISALSGEFDSSKPTQSGFLVFRHVKGFAVFKGQFTLIWFCPFTCLQSWWTFTFLQFLKIHIWFERILAPSKNTLPLSFARDLISLSLHHRSSRWEERCPSFPSFFHKKRCNTYFPFLFLMVLGLKTDRGDLVYCVCLFKHFWCLRCRELNL